MTDNKNSNTFDTIVLIKAYLEGVSGVRTKHKSQFDRLMVPQPADAFHLIVAYGNHIPNCEEFSIVRVDVHKRSGETRRYSRDEAADTDEPFDFQSELIFQMGDEQGQVEIGIFLRNCINSRDGVSCDDIFERTYVYSENSDTIILPYFTRMGPPATASDVLVCIQRQVHRVKRTSFDAVPDLSDRKRRETFLRTNQARLVDRFAGVLLHESCKISRRHQWSVEELKERIRGDEKIATEIALGARVCGGGGPNSVELWEFSERSVPWLDHKIEWLLDTHTPSAQGLQAYEIAMGSYLAVVIGTNYEGRWFRDDSGRISFEGRNSKVLIHPSDWVRNRFNNEHSIAAQYRAACLQLERDRK